MYSKRREFTQEGFQKTNQVGLSGGNASLNHMLSSSKYATHSSQSRFIPRTAGNSPASKQIIQTQPVVSINNSKAQIKGAYFGQSFDKRPENSLLD